MDSLIRTQLTRINQRFYERHAAAFDHSRQHPWPGWKRLLGELPWPQSMPLHCLDVGCGNGRLGRFLQDQRSGPLHYTGLDRCQDLLSAGQELLADFNPAARLLAGDLEAADSAIWVARESQHLVTVFGVLHHVAGLRQRQELIANLLPALRPGGLLVMTVWRHNRHPRFANKCVDWQEYNEQRRLAGVAELDLQQLSPGDHLLKWAGDGEFPRYCHFPSPAEVEQLRPKGLEWAERYTADGRDGQDNLYLILRRPDSAPAPGAHQP